MGKKERTFDLTKPLDMIRYIVKHPFAMSYEHVIVTSDGGLICSTCVKENYKEIYMDTRDGYCLQWEATALICENELENCNCSHCAKPLGYQDD